MTTHVDTTNSLIIAILVLAFGTKGNGRIAFLTKYNIPAAVRGGLVCRLIVAVIDPAFGQKIVFDMRQRDMPLLAFFSTIGLSARFSKLAEGGVQGFLSTSSFGQ